MDNTSKQAVNEFAKLSWRERICYGAGDLAQNLIFGTIGSMLLFYLTTVFGISAAAGATIFLIVRWSTFFGTPGLERLSIRATLSMAASTVRS